MSRLRRPAGARGRAATPSGPALPDPREARGASPRWSASRRPPPRSPGGPPRGTGRARASRRRGSRPRAAARRRRRPRAGRDRRGRAGAGRCRRARRGTRCRPRPRSSSASAPRSSEPHGRLTVTRSATPRSAAGSDSAAATTNSRVRQAALRRRAQPHDGTPRPCARRRGRCPSPAASGSPPRWRGRTGRRRCRGPRCRPSTGSARAADGLADVHLGDAAAGHDAHGGSPVRVAIVRRATPSQRRDPQGRDDRPTLRLDVDPAHPPVRAAAGGVPPVGPAHAPRSPASSRGSSPRPSRDAVVGARRQLRGAGAGRQEHRRPRASRRTRTRSRRSPSAPLARLRPPGRRRAVPADPADAHRRSVDHEARSYRIHLHVMPPAREELRRARRVPRRAPRRPGAPRTPTPRPRADRRGRRPTAPRPSCTRHARPTSSRTRCTGSGSGGRPRTRRPAAAGLDDRDAWAAASSGGCSASRPGRWATGWSSLDPDPACPASAVADELIVGALRRRRGRPAAGRAQRRRDLRAGARRPRCGRGRRASGAPLRPGLAALRATQDRLAERRFIREIGEYAAPVARGARRRRGRGRRGRAGLPVPAQAAARRLRRAEPGAGPRARPRSRPRSRSLGGEDGRPLLLEARDRLRGRAVGDPRPRPRRADPARSRRRATSTTPGSCPRASRPAPIDPRAGAHDAAEIAEQRRPPPRPRRAC